MDTPAHGCDTVGIRPQIKQRWLILLVFCGFFLSYISISPGAIAGMGYTGEEIESGSTMLAAMNHWLHGTPVTPVKPSRHGPIPVLLDLPFLFAGGKIVSPDFGLSFEPVLTTALLVTLIFVWVRRWNSTLVSLTIATVAAFGTMLWPYAYIGLETKQSLFLVLAGYLALCNSGRVTWMRTIGLALASGLAISVKSTSICLLPAICFLIWVYFRREWSRNWWKVALALATVASFVLISSYFRALYWAGAGGAGMAIWRFMVDPVQFLLQVGSEFGSVNKGLFVYAPIVLLAVFRIPAAFKEAPDVVIFALLTLGGLVGLFAMLLGWSDEVWGPRYLESAVAPLILCLGASRLAPTVRNCGVFFALAGIGVAISFLGAVFYYGTLHVAASQSGQNTLENLQDDLVWNPIHFDGHLFWLWLHPNASAIWVPEHHWLYAPPPGWTGWPKVDLRSSARPQSPLLRDWSVPKTGLYFLITGFYLSSLILGPLLLIAAFVVAAREAPGRARAPDRAPPVEAAQAVLAGRSTRESGSKRGKPARKR